MPKEKRDKKPTPDAELLGKILAAKKPEEKKET